MATRDMPSKIMMISDQYIKRGVTVSQPVNVGTEAIHEIYARMVDLRYEMLP